MARISHPWNAVLIKAMKGTLDFYYWKGIPVVRSWPTYRPQNFSPRSRQQWPKFATVSSSYRNIQLSGYQALQQMGAYSQASPRDVYIALNYAKVITFVMAAP